MHVFEVESEVRNWPILFLPAEGRAILSRR
jgi:hypothetical protein